MEVEYTPHISFDSKAYKNSDEFWNDVSCLQRILTSQGYSCLFRYEDSGIYVLEYLHDEQRQPWGCPFFMAVTPEEEEMIIRERYPEEEE